MKFEKKKFLAKNSKFCRKVEKRKAWEKSYVYFCKGKIFASAKATTGRKKTAASNRNAKLRLRPHKSDAEILLLAPDVRLLVYAQANENNIERKIDAMSEETPSSSTVYTHTHSLIRIRINS